ncbi:hypothetical protein [Dyella sp.]|nr:hypothetical protein [Dyella sp.]HET7331509.1 hypothetical protein [Dyella sp.]
MRPAPDVLRAIPIEDEDNAPNHATAAPMRVRDETISSSTPDR